MLENSCLGLDEAFSHFRMLDAKFSGVAGGGGTPLKGLYRYAEVIYQGTNAFLENYILVLSFEF